ncbi:MAG: ethanolamine ammonia-lyase [Burkholderiales bacterium PBB6]|nr:MAG: ethanolamine ammonia-lyase [Burkholderiales bacterium PBB6]
MSDQHRPTVTPNPWSVLRAHTPARIGLGRAGVSLPTAQMLEFQLAHAQARDAVHTPLDTAVLAEVLQAQGHSTMALHSAAADRATYLQRPDLGRRLDKPSRELLLGQASAASCVATEDGKGDATAPGWRHDIAFVVVDGLSALAVQRHAAPVLQAVMARLAQSPSPWRVAPVSIVRQGRVAVGDDVGGLLGASIVVVLIGERPGLSSPDSLGIYLTWAPQPGRSDAERNCISNVRPEGLGFEAAAHRLGFLLDEARARRLTGVALKDESTPWGDEARLTGTAPTFALTGPDR